MKTLKNLIVLIALLIGSVSCEAQMVPGIGQFIPPRASEAAQSPVKLGNLFNWWAITDAKKITSSDEWRVPTYNDWQTLYTTCGGWTVAGGKLKETGTTYWLTPNTGATDLYEMSIRGCGYAVSTGGFSGLYTESRYSAIYSGWYLYEKFSNNSAQAVDTWITLDDAAKKMGVSVVLVKTNSTLSNYTGNDGHIYSCVKIGNQVWMAEPLAESKFRDGSAIPLVTGNSNWAATTTSARRAMNDDNSYVFQ